MKRGYPSYADSGVGCLGQIPAHWQVMTLGRLGRFFKGSGGTKAEKSETGYPCVWYGDLYTQHESHITSTVANISAEIAENYEQIQYGDLLLAGSDVTPWRIGRSAVNLITERAYCGADTIIFRPKGKLNARYLGYLGDCVPSRYQKLCMGRGVTVMHIYSSELKNLVIPLPPLDEQSAIAAFLDRETARIDQLVAKHELLIERLAEYRNAVITRAVTRGLNSSTSLKPSGTPWLGQIPAHWEVKRLKWSLDSVVNGIWGGEPDGENDIACVRVADFDRQCFRVRIADPTIRAIEPSQRAGRELRPGNLLIEKSGGGEKQIVGAVMYYDHCLPAVSSNFVGRITIRDDNVPRFWAYVHAMLYAGKLTYPAIKQTTGIQNLDTDAYFNTEVGFPPHAEQRAIAEYLDQKTARIDALSQRAGTAIERLNEYRVALINAAVTGKIDVREPSAAEEPTE